MAFGDFMLMVALQWMVLETTNSALSLGLVWATRSAPHLFFGLLAGALADRADRQKILLYVTVLLAVCAGAMGLVVAQGWVKLVHVLLFTLITSSLATFSMPARQALAVDIVGRREAMGALSMLRVAMSLTRMLGGAISGLVIARLAPAWPFVIVIAGYLAGLLALIGVRSRARHLRSQPAGIRGNLIEGLKIIPRNQIVLSLVVMAVVCEILGFSHKALLPIFARDVLAVGAVGLGMLNAVQALGGLLAALFLAGLGDFRHKGRLILGIFLLFGVSLLLFSRSPWYALSLALLGLVGAMAAGFDTMQHTMLQLNVADEQRGRAMGIWQLSIGFGPVGSLAAGTVAACLGAPLALSINGGLIIAGFFLLLFFAPRLRRA